MRFLRIAAAVALVGCRGYDSGYAPRPERVVTTVALSVADTALEVGQFTQASVVTFDQFGVAIGMGPATFSSSAPTIAAVNPNDGRLLAIAEGSATIAATAGGKTATRVVTVKFPEIFINEVSPAGVNGWVELFNPTDHVIDLGGWTLTNSNLFSPVTIPAGVVIIARGFLVIDERALPGGLQTRDAVHLFSRFGVQSDAFTWAHDPATSFARCPDAAGGFIEPELSSKGATNDCP